MKRDSSSILVALIIMILVVIGANWFNGLEIPKRDLVVSNDD